MSFVQTIHQALAEVALSTALATAVPGALYFGFMQGPMAGLAAGAGGIATGLVPAKFQLFASDDSKLVAAAKLGAVGAAGAFLVLSYSGRPGRDALVFGALVAGGYYVVAPVLAPKLLPLATTIVTKLG